MLAASLHSSPPHFCATKVDSCGARAAYLKPSYSSITSSNSSCKKAMHNNTMWYIKVRERTPSSYPAPTQSCSEQHPQGQVFQTVVTLNAWPETLNRKVPAATACLEVARGGVCLVVACRHGRGQSRHGRQRSCRGRVHALPCHVRQLRLCCCLHAAAHCCHEKLRHGPAMKTGRQAGGRAVKQRTYSWDAMHERVARCTGLRLSSSRDLTL